MPAEMNPRERWGLLLIDELPDRPPAYPLVTSHAAKIHGCDLIEYCTDGRILAEAQLAAQHKYGHDGLSVFTDVGLLAEAMGSKYHLRKFEVPILDLPVIEQIEQIGDLRMPDPAKSGRLPVYLEAIDRLFTSSGDTLPVFAFIPCPFTTAAGLRGIDEFLMDTIMEPQAAHALLDISLKAAISFSDECILAGALPMLVDPLASGSVISNKTYKEFALPYQRKFIDYLHRYDLDVTLHICGDTSDQLELIAQSGADLFSFDKTEIHDVKACMGEKIRLVGNLPPNALLKSSSIDTALAVKEALKQGSDAPRGFVLSTGCEVPIQCQTNKLQELISIGKKAFYEEHW